MKATRQIVYMSDIEQNSITSDAVTEILNASLRNNPSLDVTGILLFDYHHFLQVLEGPSEAVEHLYTKISKDERHLNVKIISDNLVKQRSFAKWTMGFRHPNKPLSESINVNSPNADDALALLLYESLRIK